MKRRHSESEVTRTWSLQREWSRAFAVLLVLITLVAAATITGARAVVNDVQGTARQMNRESFAIDALRADLVDHEETAHKLLSDEPVDRRAYVEQQFKITTLFEASRPDFPTVALRSSLLATFVSWRSGLVQYGLWSTELSSLRGFHGADNPTFGASSDGTDAMLDALEGPALRSMNHSLDRSDALETILTVLLGALFLVALTVTFYFRRRMTRDLVRPIGTLHRGVVHLKEGEYDFRIEVGRRDELGELSEAFNEMARALRESHEELTLRATHDSLTGLPNRAALLDRLEQSFAERADRRSTHETVLFIDIDDFKDVNSALGHEGGDVLLSQLAERLTECVRPQDLVARLGGDEFAVVVSGDENNSTARIIAERILGVLEAPFEVGGTRLQVNVSIGLAQRDGSSADVGTLVRNADVAMYTAKGAGKGRYEMYDAQPDERFEQVDVLR